MKKAGIVIILLLVIMQSCEDGIKIAEKDVTYTNSFNMVVPENGPLSLTINRSFGTDSNPEVREIIKEIDRYHVNGVSYEVDDFTGEPTKLVKLTITITSADGEELATEILSDISLQEISGAGKQVIAFEPEEFDAVEAELKRNNEINYLITGEIDNKPVSFDLSVIMEMTIEYRVLD